MEIKEQERLDKMNALKIQLDVLNHLMLQYAGMPIDDIIVLLNEKQIELHNGKNRPPLDEAFRDVRITSIVWSDGKHLDTKIRNSCKQLGITTIGELADTPRLRFVRLRNSGFKSIDTIGRVLKERFNYEWR